MKELQNTEEFNAYIQEGPVVFLFTAGWCPDCRVIEPVLPEIEEAYSQFEFIEVNRDNFIELCQEYDIYGIPSFLVFEKGAELGRFVSKDRKTKEEIESFLEDVQKAQ
ncbi:thioredoxin family protein [Oceanobacillus sp. FSL W8-0428]|uniref:Thiol reductase thioredoxin n=1 Tax=Oceanobacillus sojae TaxID=582851 RepID=A0A511ZKM3_9BACI|nr:thioredoxin family protein [Oceanobacillus sojae]GEN88004.1 thiol reductase thioredoxin [Oceanobacillus sojae]